MYGESSFADLAVHTSTEKNPQAGVEVPAITTKPHVRGPEPATQEHSRIKMELTLSQRLVVEHADYVAGLFGGVAGLAIGHPFDTLKVRQQTAGGHNFNMLQTLALTWRNDGMRGFFKGMSFPLTAVGFLNSMFFGVYGTTIRYLDRVRCEPAGPSMSSVMIAGSIAGGLQAIPATPIELVKVKLQCQTGGVSTYEGPVHCLQSIYGRYGLRGCFHGLGATVLREVPGLTMYIVSYEYMMGLARKEQGTEDGQLSCPLHVNLVVGGLSGMLSWAINIPFDIVKSRLQNDDLANPKYRGIRDCAARLYEEGGMRVFWRGLPVVCLRAFPTNAVTFTVYTNTLLYIYNMQHKPPPEAGPTVLD